MYQETDVIYIGADVHEKETQLAIFEPGGTLLQENRIPTNDLASAVSTKVVSVFLRLTCSHFG